MTTDRYTGYSHTQRSPICLLIYALAILFLVLGWFVRDPTWITWLFPLVGMLMFLIAGSFHYLKVEDLGDTLTIGFGPIPLFRKSVNYSDIKSVEIGRTLLVDGWGIHLSIRGGWVWNLWGRCCVVLRFKNGDTLRIGTDDSENLAALLRSRIVES